MGQALIYYLLELMVFMQNTASVINIFLAQVNLRYQSLCKPRFAFSSIACYFNDEVIPGDMPGCKTKEFGQDVKIKEKYILR